MVVGLVFVGCGDTIGNISSEERIHGGTASAPAQMSLDVSNLIVENSYYNYFKYTADGDHKLKLDAMLDFGITKTQRIECQESGDTYVVVYDGNMNEINSLKTCATAMTVEFPANGTYIFQFKYPGNKGYFNADILAL